MARAMRVRNVLLAASLAAGLGVAPAQPQAKLQNAGAAPRTYTLDDLKRVETARDEALKRLKALETAGATAEREEAAIDGDLLVAAADSRRREEAAVSAERRLIQLDREVADARDHILRDQAALDDLLAALMSFGSRRPPALAASPGDTGAAVRAAILMSDAAPALAARADALKVRVVALNALLEETRTERDLLSEAEQGLVARAEEIAALAAEKRIVRASLAAETTQLKTDADRLAREADTLRDLLESLSAAAPARPGQKPKPGEKKPSSAPGQKPPPKTSLKAPAAEAGAKAAPRRESPASSGVVLAPRPAAPAGSAPLAPAVGKIARRYGQSVNGVPASGLTYATRAGAQVIAPLDARVEYAGVFRSYGQMLILDVGGDMLVVVSGLDALYPEAGQWVLAGEPIGRMADRKSPSPELYLEVRRKGQTIDPQIWLGRGA
jgi:septal ring factor EnvC (AmiA/AmiB activator)